MRLIAKNYVPIAVVFFSLYWLKGLCLVWFEGWMWHYPDFMLFHLNPRIDRMAYWLMNDLSLILAGVVISSRIINRSFTSPNTRIFFHAVQSMMYAEFFEVLVVQLFLSGESYNSLFTILIGIAIFIKKLLSHVKKNIRANGQNNG